MTAADSQTQPPSLQAPAVVRLLVAQRELYEELDALSQKQGELISEHRTDELLELLGRRQVLLERVQAVTDTLAPVRARWPQFLATLDPAQRHGVGQVVDAITQLIESITRRDQADRDCMIAERERVAGELATLDRSRRATGAYGGPRAGGGPMFQDREA
ncbi:MAG: hypothetical protein GIKADHBN_01128 [Phycisphaerales bacterium]|nr:hypothetical protein [Phycisphaerales bacterium]